MPEVDPGLRTVEGLALRDGTYAHVLGATGGRVAVPEIDGAKLDLDALWAEVEALERRLAEEPPAD